jgi:hypothetical protein
MQRRWLWSYVGVATALMLLVHFAPVLADQFLPIEITRDRQGHVQLLVTGSLLKLVSPVLVFAIAAVVIGAIASRDTRPASSTAESGGIPRPRLHRELAVGSALLVLVQWIVWTVRADGRLGTLLANPIQFKNDEGGMTVPPFMGLLIVNILSMFVAVGCGVGAQRIMARLRGDPPSSEHASTTRWGRVGASVLATAVVCLLFVRLAGPPLQFYWSCDLADSEDRCAADVAPERVHRGDFYFWREVSSDAARAVILDPWNYALFATPLFAIGPAVVAMTTRRGRGRTGAWAALLAWPAVALGAFVFLGFGRFETVIVMAIRLHVLAAVPWVGAGLVGVWLGNRLGPKVDYAEQHGIELPPAPERSYRNW